MSNADPSTTESTRTPRRRAGLTAAALSVGMAAAALAAVAAPSTASTDDVAWAMTAEASPTAIEPLMLSVEDRAAAAAQSSRSSQRGAVPEQQKVEKVVEVTPEVVGTRYTTTKLNVRTKPKAETKVVAVLEPAKKVKITDQKKGDYRQILYKGDYYWVTAQYLSKSKPDLSPPPPPKPAGPSGAACASGSGVEAGLSSNAIAVHRAVCNAFPSVTSYGGVRSGGGAHGSGHALDIMVTGSTGDQIAAYLRANARALGVSEVIWAQRIWTVQRSSEGWRWMPDRGSTTANHYDHVHVTVY